jgi:hypothetical protein
MLMPVDEFLPATYVKHPRKDLAEALFRVYARMRLRSI